ncbi:MAG: hypothetical protein U0R19_03420 [Bryobacteraceae bacterium]
MKARVRNVAMVLVGVVVLLWKGGYRGPYEELVRSYAGNTSMSFAVYFLMLRVVNQRWKAAGLALGVVCLFEATDGFGVMTNTYDRWDFVANSMGVGLGWALDAVISRGAEKVVPG